MSTNARGARPTDGRRKNGAHLVPWRPGQSGNPSGRPKGTVDLRTKCREMTPALLDRLCAIALSGKERSSDQIKAAELIIAYGFGRPPQHLAVELDPATVQAINGSMSVEEAARLYAATISAGTIAVTSIAMQGAPLLEASAVEQEP